MSTPISCSLITCDCSLCIALQRCQEGLTIDGPCRMWLQEGLTIGGSRGPGCLILFTLIAIIKGP